MSQSRINASLAALSSQTPKQNNLQKLEDEIKSESLAISLEVLREYVKHNIEQKIPQQLTQNQENEFKSNLTRILIEENVAKGLHNYIIKHQLDAIKNLLKEFTVYDPKLVRYSKQKANEDIQRCESVGISEEIYLKIQLRLAREDSVTRGILKYVEEQDMRRRFNESYNNFQKQVNLDVERGPSRNLR